MTPARRDGGADFGYQSPFAAENQKCTGLVGSADEIALVDLDVEGGCDQNFPGIEKTMRAEVLIGDGEHRGAHAAALAVTQQVGPRLA